MNENRNLEFKENVTNTFLKTVSAFSNFGSGEIRFGVSDDGKIIGISHPEQTKLDLENRINDSIQPKPDYHFVSNTDGTLSLFVEEGPYKPYLYRGKAYRRSDTATIECDQTELRRLVLEGENLTFDVLPTRQQNLQFHTLEGRMQETLEIEHLNEDILKTLNLYSEKNGFDNAAALLADQNEFPGTDMIRFGSSIDIIRERVTRKNISILEQYDSAVAMYKRYYQEERIQGIEREKKERIPEKAFREAMANALAHRTWDVNTDIHVSMFEDRIEITSPGGLPEGISPQEYLKVGISILRNPVLATVLFRLRYMEAFGTGVTRIRSAYHDSSVQPQFDIEENSITVVLPVIRESRPLTDQEKTVFEILAENGEMTSAQLASLTGYSKAKVIRLLNQMIQNNSVIKTGNGRGTAYRIRS